MMNFERCWGGELTLDSCLLSRYEKSVSSAFSIFLFFRVFFKICGFCYFAAERFDLQRESLSKSSRSDIKPSNPWILEKTRKKQKIRKCGSYWFFVMSWKTWFQCQFSAPSTFKIHHRRATSRKPPLHGHWMVPWIMKHLLQSSDSLVLHIMTVRDL